MVPSDLPSVAVLFDATLGPGFWGLDLGAPGSHVVAVSGNEIMGAASAIVAHALDQTPDMPGPVGVISLMAVRPEARRMGIGTRLAEAVSEGCGRLGVSSLAAFAWVHGDSGECPLAGVLERLGFSRQARLDDFYAGMGVGSCPQCRCEPCVCWADLYTRRIA